MRLASRRWPVIFGFGATPILMAVAANQGLRLADVVRMTGMAEGTVRDAIDRLLRCGLLRRERRRYNINHALADRADLVAVLHALCEVHGLPLHVPRLPKGHLDASIPMPTELFVGKTRRKALCGIALLGQSYTQEMCEMFGVDLTNMNLRLRELRAEGVLLREEIGRVSAYGLNPAFPGASALRRILVSMARGRTSVGSAVAFARARRQALASSHRQDLNRIAQRLRENAEAIFAAASDPEK